MKIMLSKALVLAIICLFIGAGFVPSLSGDIEVNQDNENDEAKDYVDVAFLPPDDELDQYHYKFTTGSALFYESENNMQFNAQSFIPTMPTLTRVRLKIWANNKETSCDLKVSVRENLEDNDITSISMSNNQMSSSGYYFYNFDFPDIDVNVGQTYYIVTECFCNTLYTSFCCAFGKDGEYDNGEMWTTLSGGTWWKYSDDDLVFETYGIPTDEVILSKSIMCDWVNGLDDHGPPKTEFELGDKCYCYNELYNIEEGDILFTKWLKDGVVKLTSDDYITDWNDFGYFYWWYEPEEDGDWQVDIYCNNEKIGSSPDFEVIKDPGETVYRALLMGINAWDSVLPETFGSWDVNDIYNNLLSTENWDKNSIYMYQNDAVTLSNFRDGMDFLDNADSNDVSLFYFSGHGGVTQTTRYYLNLKGDTTFSHGSGDILSSYLDQIDGKIIVVLDSCNSGGFIDSLQDENRVIITSCDKDELAHNSALKQRGAFSYTMIKGLEGLADSNDDNEISTYEWFDYHNDNWVWKLVMFKIRFMKGLAKRHQTPMYVDNVDEDVIIAYLD